MLISSRQECDDYESIAYDTWNYLHFKLENTTFEIPQNFLEIVTSS